MINCVFNCCLFVENCSTTKTITESFSNRCLPQKYYLLLPVPLALRHVLRRFLHISSFWLLYVVIPNECLSFCTQKMERTFAERWDFDWSQIIPIQLWLLWFSGVPSHHGCVATMVFRRFFWIISCERARCFFPEQFKYETRAKFVCFWKAQAVKNVTERHWPLASAMFMFLQINLPYLVVVVPKVWAKLVSNFEFFSEVRRWFFCSWPTVKKNHNPPQLECLTSRHWTTFVNTDKSVYMAIRGQSRTATGNGEDRCETPARSRSTSKSCPSV